ncbi:7-cyano-7-deazaguanine synthase QueC [Neptuniibacter sp. 2_MG-2023]|uniref:7-cyano-7-deazaguanine synthase QueC n=1 Tax=Neptuniibacter sp. 2_MG-2023 TaxID=3062671 RepID=UPI0026E24568|nr:7-cyano-7-deazaguanine synthase QueC [Neptuniibacter sp. 2_MG-2023]MDO6515355.1 7-cyano-7-deazaguanine synthase QueC [Neptuniibacter sp. 2_MG-2023]
MNTPASPKAVVLLSGGLDSATALAIASDRGYDCYVLSFDYGQRSLTELNAAKEIAKQLKAVEHQVIRLHLEDFGGSALTDHSIDVPEEETDEIPVTYVPARNTVFMSLALGWAEVLEADAIFIGVNAVDYSGYPDCRPEYIAAFETMANLATKRGVSGDPIRIETPLIDLTKEQIIQAGTALNVDYGLTISCYQADDQGRACGVCDSCRLRTKGFVEAGIKDPTRYQ